MGQTVNLLPSASVVRIHLPPPHRSKRLSFAPTFFISQRTRFAAKSPPPSWGSAPMPSDGRLFSFLEKNIGLDRSEDPPQARRCAGPSLWQIRKPLSWSLARPLPDRSCETLESSCSPFPDRYSSIRADIASFWLFAKEDGSSLCLLFKTSPLSGRDGGGPT